MSVTTEPAQELLEQTRRSEHPHCTVCSQGGPCGLGLQFDLSDDGSVEGRFTGRETLQGYPGTLHGGISSLLLDGAMTNCLFAHGIVAVTGRMTVRFRHPVQVALPLEVRGYLVKSQGPLHTVRGEITQGGTVMATAEAKFMERPGTTPYG
ncbi:MAG: PaaI family thioesterase [Pirellulales bacterium]|nr:PaaI family thioesterase [Pirellulales bacterium]